MGLPTSISGENRPAQTVAEVTGGQPLEEWLKKVMATDDDIYRMQNFLRLFESLNTVEDLQTALKVLAANTNGRGRGMRFTEYSMLLQKLTQVDSKAALDFATAQQGGERLMATATVLRAWAKTSPDAALAWAKENGMPQDPNANADGDRRGNDNWALASVVTQLAKTNLDRALQEASGAELGRTSGRTADSLMSESLEQRGPDGAKSIAETLPEGQFKTEFIQQLTDRLAQTDPVGTSEWVLKMGSGDTKRRALGELVDEWVGKDKLAATAFVDRLPIGPDSDSARREYASEMARENPAKSLQEISKISAPERQLDAVRDIARDLARRDMALAQQFVNNSGLAEEVRMQLNQQIAQRQGGGPGGGPGDFRRRFAPGGPQ